MYNLAFVWDDEIDDGITDISHNEEVTQVYYQQSLSYIQQKLAIDNTLVVSATPGPNMALLADVGDAHTDQAFDTASTMRSRTMQSTLAVNTQSSSKYDIPTVEEYIKIQSGFVSCAPVVACSTTFTRRRKRY